MTVGGARNSAVAQIYVEDLIDVNPKRKFTGPGKIGFSLTKATTFHPWRSNCACNDEASPVSKRLAKGCPSVARATKNPEIAPRKLPDSARMLPSTGPHKT